MNKVPSQFELPFEPKFELTPMREAFTKFSGLHRTIERGRKRHQVMKLIASSFKRMHTK